MITVTRSVRRAMSTLTAIAALVPAGCKLGVLNPGVIDASKFDPGTDAPSLSLSGQTAMWQALGGAAIFGAYFSTEMEVGATRQETNDFGRRVITPDNLDINPNIWSPLSQTIGINERLLQIVGTSTSANADIDVARSAMSSAFALEIMGEYFCQGVVLGGPPLTPAQTLDSSIVRFKRAITVGNAAGAAGTAEGTSVAAAAAVGLAQAYLQKGDYANAAATAATVPASFEYDADYVNDQSNLARVANPVINFQTQYVVPPAYQALNDARVPNQDMGMKAADGILELVEQLKFTAYASPMRIASSLEAQYIAAEAALRQGNAAPAIALIAARQAAGGSSAAPVNGATVLAQLMDERARDFWLEGKHMADFVRNPTATPYVGQTGQPFYKPSQGAFGNLTCLPVPREEINANPHFPR